MKKEEAVELLKGKKVYVNGKSKEIQEKLFELGFLWDDGDDKVCYVDKPFLFTSNNTSITHGTDMEHFKSHEYKEISADEILSIKLEHEFKPFEKVLVRDDNSEWQADLFSHKLTDKIHSFQCVFNRWVHCIPYEGNEDLLGTNNPCKK